MTATSDSVRRIAIVVPCYNEAVRLPVARFEACVQSTSIEFVFVDDGSTDGTGALLEKLQAVCPNRIALVSCGVNQGKGEAVRLGMRAAFARGIHYAGYWDADLATPLDAIWDFMAVLETRPTCQMVFGARVQLLGREIERSPGRHYLGRVFATVAARVLQLAIYDTQCGAKLFRATPETAALFADAFCSRWVFDLEIIARYIQAVGSAKTAASHIFEFPLYSWKDVAGSKVKPRHFFLALLDMYRINRRYGRRTKSGRPTQRTREARP